MKMAEIFNYFKKSSQGFQHSPVFSILDTVTSVMCGYLLL